MPLSCIDCSIDQNPKSADCVYGQPIETNCTVKSFAKCQGDRGFNLSGVCRFCYQTPAWMHVCTPMTSCKRDSHVRLYKVNCTVEEHVVCLGNRLFSKNVECNWTSGHKWSVAMILSITLGGFGADRFYLGLYKVSI